MQQKYTSLIFIGLLNLITCKIAFCQNEIFSFIETKDNIIEIDVKNDLRYNLNINENKIIFRGVVFNSGINQSQYTNFKEKRLSSYDVNGFDIKIQYITNAIPLGVTLEFTNTDSLLVPFDPKVKLKINIKQSSLIIVIRDSNIVNYLESNSTVLSISPLFKLLESRTSEKISAVVYQLTSVNDPDEFFLKLNQIMYNIDRQSIVKNQSIPINIRKKNSLEIYLNSSIISTNDHQFNSFTNKQLGFNFLRDIKDGKIQLGVGLNYSLNKFSSEDNAKYFSESSQYLDTIYATIKSIKENHTQHLMSCNAKIILNIPVQTNTLSIYFTPFHSIYNQYQSELIGGAVLTYGKYNGLNEYLYNIEELGLGEKNTELIGNQSHYSSTTYGLNIGVSYNFMIDKIKISPIVNLNYLTINNKAKTIESYSINSGTYNGFFSSKQKVNFLFPSIGLSIKF